MSIRPSVFSIQGEPDEEDVKSSECRGPKTECSLSVSQLTLSNFRNYGELRLLLDAAPVVLTGQNGAGKTNLLEALSLLVPGRGLCRAAPAEWQNTRVPLPWAVAVALAAPEGEILIGTGRDPSDAQSDHRVVRVDGRKVRSQQILADHVAMTWITPEMDRVLGEGPSARRKWLDRMVFSFDPAHAGRVHRYEKAMRERLRLLREGTTDAAWLSGLEDEMARTGVAIAAARKELVARLRTAMAQTQSAFPRAELSLSGMAEEALETAPALVVEEGLRQALSRAREGDAQTGTCAAGPHRSDLVAVHASRHCPATLCSTGEQKALLIAVMLAYVRTIERARGMKPLFLLDDITAHLDAARRAALFEEILDLSVQAWMTGTEAGAFSPIFPAARHFTVEEGIIREVG